MPEPASAPTSPAMGSSFRLVIRLMTFIIVNEAGASFFVE
jgi:hypothetical protein